MTHTLKIAAFALLATAGAASAMTAPSGLVGQVERATSNYTVEFDANALSAAQLRHILNAVNSGDSVGEVNAQIASIAK